MLLLMDKILHQLIGSFSIIYVVLYIPGGAGFLQSTGIKPISQLVNYGDERFYLNWLARFLNQQKLW